MGPRLQVPTSPEARPASLFKLENVHHPLMKQLGQAPMVSCGEQGFPHDAEHFLSILQGGNDPPVSLQREKTCEGSMMERRTAIKTPENQSLPFRNAPVTATTSPVL